MLYFVLILGMVMAFFWKNQKISAIVFTGILTVMASFRFGIGADYFAYEFLYSKLKLYVIPELLFGTEKQEVGFRVLGSLIKSFGVSYQGYLTILAIFTLYYIYRMSVEYTKNPTLSLVVYYSFFYFVWVYSGLRQGLAMSVGIYYLLKAIEKNEKKPFYIACALLFTIHSSSIVLLALYFMASKIHWNRERILLVLGVSVIVALIPLGLVVDKLSRYLSILNRLTPYLDEVFTPKDLLGFQVLARLFFIGLALFYYNKLSEKSTFLKLVTDVYLLSFAFYFALQFSELTAARISVYGRLLEIILLPQILTLRRPKLESKMYLAGLLLLLSLYFVKETNTMSVQAGLVNRTSPLVPYINVMNKEDHYYNTYFYYIMHYKGIRPTPRNFPMKQ